MRLKKKLGQITESENLNELLKRILDLSQEVLQSEAATLFLVDKATDELVFKIVNGPTSQELQGKRIKIGEGIAGKTAREGKAFVVNKTRDSGYAEKFDRQTGFSTESLMAAPLIVDGETIGVIEVINSKGGDYNDRSKQIIEHLAAQVSSELKMALLSERLSKSEEFLNSVINSLPGGIIILDEKGVIRKSNSTVRKMLDRKDIEGQKLENVLPYSDILENINNTKGGGFQAVIRRNGKEAHYDFELSSAKEISPSGIEREYLIVQISDITERVELDRLKYLQEVNANFVCGLSHRLRTPLTPILGLSSILKDQKDLQRNFKDMVEIIYGASLEMKDMVEKLLDIASVGTNKTIDINQKVNITSVLNEIISGFDSVPFKFFTGGDKDLFVIGNYTWLSKSLKQLFTIGLKESSKKLKVKLEGDKEYVYLNFKGFHSLIDDFSALANISIFQFDNPLTGDSDIKYLDIPLIRLILNRHNVKITVNESKALISLRFEKA
jgi:PAS domain S-box-containing protein